MKHKTNFLFATLAGVVVLCLLLGGQASAQSKSGQNSASAPRADHAQALIKPENNFAKTSDGVLVDTHSGAVLAKEIDENGVETTVVFEKPIASQYVESDLREYTRAYKAWAAHNPNYEDYLSPEQRKMFNSGAIKELYRYELRNTRTINR